MAIQTRMVPAIVLSGQTTALGVVRALGAMGVPVVVIYYDERDTAHLSKYCSYHISAPHPEQSEDDFIALLMESSRRFGGAVLFPVSDETVAAVARHKDILDRCYIVACQKWEIVSQFIDKKRTYALAETSGVPSPMTVALSSLQEVKESGKRFEFPCLVKPCQSHLFFERFHRKMFVVSNMQELQDAYGRAADAGLDVLLQEVIPGDDGQVVNYNAYIHEGVPALEFTAPHVRNGPPLWGPPRVAVSRDIPEVIGPGRKILQSMGFQGYACTEFKKDARDGVYKLMDVNGRHNLSTLLARRCGVDFAWLHYRHLAYGEVPSARVFQTGVYWIDLTRDVAYSVRYLASERYSPLRYVQPYFQPHVFAILDLRDPMPFIRRCTFLAWQALRGLVTRFPGFPRKGFALALRVTVQNITSVVIGHREAKEAKDRNIG